MSTQILSNLLAQRFHSRPYWPELKTQLNGWPPHCGSQAVEIVGDGQLEKLSVSKHWRFSLRPFLIACNEVQSLRLMCENLTDPQLIKGQCIGKVGPTLDERTSQQFSELLEESTLCNDLANFARRFLAESSLEKMVADARWVKDANTQTATLAVGLELHWLLMVVRCLGLIDFKTLEKLRRTKIRVLGASVAASTVELLVSLGAEDVNCIDAGLIDPTNQSRLPMAKLSNWGCPKSEMLLHHLLRRNPYGKFSAIVGKAIAKESDRQATSDVLAEEFLKDAEVIIEVIDDLKMKVFIQTVALAKKPLVPLIFVADLGVTPIVKTVTADKNGKVAEPFGRVWSESERKVLAQVIDEKTSATKLQSLIPQVAYLLVKEAIPTEHTVQFLLSCTSQMSFWSQTPIASRLSAGQTALEVLKNIGIVQDESLTAHGELIAKVCQQFLGLA